MGGGGLGGSCSLEHGSLAAMEAPCGAAAPAGFCKGKSVERAPQALPQPAGWGWGVYRQGAGGPRLGLSLSHFLLLWVLPLPPLTHLPLGPLVPHAAPQGAGVPEWNHVSGKEQLAGSDWGRGSAQRPERFADQDPAWCEGRSGEGGSWGVRGQNPLPRPDPGPTLPSSGPRRGGPGAPRSADPAPGQRSRAEPPAPPGRAAARAPRSSVPIPRTGTQTRDSRGSSRGDLGPASVWRPDPEGGRWPRGHGRARRVEALGVGTPWAAALAPTAPTWASRITSVMPAPPLARPRVSPGPGLGRGAGVGLRGTPRVRGVRGHELPPLPVVPERPRPPPPYYGAAPAGPRPAPAHWLRSARSRLRGPGAAADPLSALCLPLARRPPPLSAPSADPALPALRTAPRPWRPPSSRNRPPRRPAPDRGRDRSWRTRAAGLGPGASPGGADWGRGTNGAPDEALAAEKDNPARLGLSLPPFPRSVGPAARRTRGGRPGGPPSVPVGLPRPLGRLVLPPPGAPRAPIWPPRKMAGAAGHAVWPREAARPGPRRRRAPGSPCSVSFGHQPSAPSLGAPERGKPGACGCGAQRLPS